MNAQVGEVKSILEASGLRWWIDCGTLLALVREGELFAQDTDIDLSAWDGQDEALRRALQGFRRAGYRVGRRRYRGRVARYWIKPVRGSKLRSIDLKLFVRQGRVAVSPTMHSRSNAPLRSLRHLFAEGIRIPIAFVWRRRSSRTWHLWIPSLDFIVASWAIPCRFLDQLESIEIKGLTLPTPGPIDQYLAFRYGKWRVPQADWVTHRDDGGFVLSPPEALIDQGQRKKE